MLVLDAGCGLDLVELIEVSRFVALSDSSDQALYAIR